MATEDTVKPASISSSTAGRTVVMKLSTIVKVLLVVLLVGLSFYGGVLYGRGTRNGNNAAVTSGLYNRFAIGLVVYISPTSITIANEENTYTQTFTLTKNTLISINGVKATASQIKAGNRVLIREAKNSHNKADAVIVDTNFSG